MFASPILIIGSSGRLAAEALSHAGFTVDVFDCFADTDTLKAARQVVAVKDTPHTPCVPDPSKLLPLVRDWKNHHPIGWILPTSGFESTPETLAALALFGGYAGNTAESVRACKNPWEFQRACELYGFSSPEISGCNAFIPKNPPPLTPQSDHLPYPFSTPTSQPSSCSEVWLKKRIGGSNGSHIELLHSNSDPDLSPPHYAQRKIEGESLSVLFLSHIEQDKTRVTVVSHHRQYLAPTIHQPFRFGGLVSATDLSGPVKTALNSACEKLSFHFNLRGLNSLDALWDGENLWLLEINPRPSASLALHPLKTQARLFTAHLASLGAFDTPDLFDDLSIQNDNLLNPGFAIVYAMGLLSIPADFRFPSGCHDLPAPRLTSQGQISPARTFENGEPVCSVVVPNGGLGKLRAQVKALRECLNPVAGVDLLSSL